MSEQPTRGVVERRDVLIGSAMVVLSAHVPDEVGRCQGCLDLWSRWVPHAGCTQVRWARRVLETGGVDDADWLAPPLSTGAAGPAR